MSFIRKSRLTIRILPMLLILAIFVVFIFVWQGAKKAEGAWYSTGGTWTNRKQITIDHNKVSSGPHTNFPMLFSVTDTDLKTTANGGKVGLSTGLDMVFTSSDGTTKIPYEMESYTASTGQTIAWVQVPTLSSTVDTVIYLYFGNASASDQSQATSVWDSNYKGVWHLPNGSSLTSLDSTTNANNGTLSGSTVPSATTGQVDGGASFNGTSAYIEASNNSSLQPTNGTVSAWIKTSGAGSSYRGVVVKQSYYGFFLVDNVFGIYDWGSSNFRSSGVNVGNGSWHLLTESFQSGSTNGTILYVDGSSVLTTTMTGVTNLCKFEIGVGGEIGGSGGCANGNSQLYGGTIDEPRISNIVRSAGWITTEYNNQFSPSTFYSVTALQQQPSVYSTYSSPGISWYSTGGTWTNRKQITIDHNKVSSGPHTNFPMLFSVTDTDLKTTANGGKVGLSTGLDMVFTSSDGTTKIPYEMESYTASTGQTIAWVQVPTLSSTVDTVIYLYFGNASASDQSQATSVWDSNYKAVYHLKNGVTLDLSDSTSNGFTLTANNASLSATTGQINGGADSTVSTAWASKSGSPFTFTTGDIITIEVWVKRQAIANSTYYPILALAQGTPSASKRNWELDFAGAGLGEPDKAIAVHYRDSTDATWNAYAHNTADSDTTAYHHYVFTYTFGTASTAQFYKDGATITGSWTSGTGNQTPVTSGVDKLFLFETNNAGAEVKNNRADEVRISKGIARSAGWITTEYNNQNSPSTFYSVGPLQALTRSNSSGTPVAGVGFNNRGTSSSSWYSTGGTWSNRKQITIDHTKVSGGPLTNFPMLFSVTDNDLKFTGSGGKVASSTGLEMVFTSSDGSTALNYEMESYASTTGQTIAWVQIPTLSSTVDTIIYVYFGGDFTAINTDHSNRTGTWDSNYKGVWHLPNGSTLTALDSTTNANNASSLNSTSANTGQVDGGGSFNGSSNFIDIPDSSNYDGGTSLTVSLWAKQTSLALDKALIAKWDFQTQGSWGCQSGNFTTSTITCYIAISLANDGSGYYVQTPAGSWSAGVWHHVVMTYPGAGVSIYIDGVSQSLSTTGTAPSSMQNSTATLKVGKFGGTLTRYWPGSLDEVRISSNVRSAGWIATEYNNQNSPSTFLYEGPLQAVSRKDSSATSVPAVKIRGGVKYR